MLRRIVDCLRWRKIRFHYFCRTEALKYVRSRKQYRLLTEDQIRETRRSDKVFVFGSGYSINSIGDSEWRHFSQHDTVSFNWFIYQNFVRIDYHLIREICSNDGASSIWKPQLNEYSRLIRENKHYKDTTFVVQADSTALNVFRLVGNRMLPAEARLFEFKTRSRSKYEPPSRFFSEGLVHGPSSMFDCVNFSYLMGWKKIVLVGVDLYDRRYFWLGDNQLRPGDVTRGATADMMHNTAKPTIIFAGKWKEHFDRYGVELMVYNPKSLLAEALPVYSDYFKS